MLELAKFAKQHIPEEHELDDPDFVDKRLVSLSVFPLHAYKIFCLVGYRVPYLFGFFHLSFFIQS